MKKILLICLSIFMLTACANSGNNSKQNAGTDNSTVYVYYFHGKQRCMTCNAVEKVAKQAIEENYASNPDVVFKVLATADKANEALTEKYEISWNGLVIAKGEDAADITQKAFASAVNNPGVLINLIKNEVDSRLK